jgi:dUTP pyrophosphatase
MKVKVINKSRHSLPHYATSKSAGMDLKANIGLPMVIPSTAAVLVPTGIYMQLPDEYEAQIRPRSGLALKHGITVLNSPGTIDSDYIGEIKVLLMNHSGQDFIINDGDRIAQMIIAKYRKIEWIESEILEDTERGAGGFMSTGIN